MCPACNNPYEYCHGEFRIPYFRHRDKCKCTALYSEPETEEHIKGKKDLFEWIKTQDGVTDAVLEGWLPETHQRPDIMFKVDGRQYVIEYQCTPIASEYIKRHDLYQAAGIVDIWILGTEKYFKIGSFGKQIENYTGYYYDCESQKLILWPYRSGNVHAALSIWSAKFDTNGLNLDYRLNRKRYLKCEEDITEYKSDIRELCKALGMKVRFFQNSSCLARISKEHSEYCLELRGGEIYVCKRFVSDYFRGNKNNPMLSSKHYIVKTPQCFNIKNYKLMLSSLIKTYFN